MDWAKQRVCVTGAGGFIGSHLTQKLAQLGATTRALVHYNGVGSVGWLEDAACINDIEVIAGDVQDRDCVQRALKGIDIVFHLAALIGIPYSYTNPVCYVRTNVEGTVNVLLAARDNNVGLV